MKKVSLSGNGELMQECFPRHSRMRIARVNQDEETDEEVREKRAAIMERSKPGTGLRPILRQSRRPITPVPTSYHILNEIQ